MQVDQSRARRMLTLSLVTLPCLLGLAVVSAHADGPVGPSSLPGGVTVVDSDLTGEQWGRAGGREIQFTVNVPSNFTTLTWGAVGADAVTLAFDGAVNDAGETLTLGSVVNNTATWNGTATLPLAIGPALVLPTRFTLEVVDGVGAPVALAIDPAGNRPGLDVLAAGGSFTATLRFEANHNGSYGLPAGWTPALDLFDALHTVPGTPPGTGGPALTGFESGFFFQVLAGLTLEEHDDHMASQTQMIKDALAFLTTETVNRLMQLSTDQGTQHADLHNWVNMNHQEVLAGLQNLQQAIGAIQFPPNVASADDVRQAQEDLMNVLLILFGLSPCPQDAGGACTPGELVHLFASPESVASVQADVTLLLDKVMDIQAQVQASANMPEIKVQLADVTHDSSGSVRRWIVTTTVNGDLVDADLVMLSAVTVDKNDPAVHHDVTALSVPVPLATGMQDVSLQLPQSLKDASVFQLDFAFVDGDLTARGSALVHSGQGNND